MGNPKGIDYAWANPKPSTSCLKNNDVTFIMRYFSDDPSKDLTIDELHTMNNAGIEVGVVWETTANRMLSGYNGGVQDAITANDRANSYGMKGIPLYFACDWDASQGEQATINSYLDGAASVIGKKRTGMYAGYYPLKRAFDVGKITYGWQTYAWSGGLWDKRAQVRQVQNGVTVCNTSADWDESTTTDFGQWPRPKTAGPTVGDEQEASMPFYLAERPNSPVALPRPKEGGKARRIRLFCNEGEVMIKVDFVPGGGAELTTSYDLGPQGVDVPEDCNALVLRRGDEPASGYPLVSVEILT